MKSSFANHADQLDYSQCCFHAQLEKNPQTYYITPEMKGRFSVAAFRCMIVMAIFRYSPTIVKRNLPYPLTLLARIDIKMCATMKKRLGVSSKPLIITNFILVEVLSKVRIKN